jgi:urease accessory protein
MNGVGLARLLQLASPALPVGAFSYSEGLEALVQAGRLPDAEAVRLWLEGELERGSLPIEAAALGPLREILERWQADTAPAVWRELVDLDGWLLAQREAAAVRAQLRQMGGSLLQLLADLGWPLSPAAPASASLSWPTAWAWAGLCLEISRQDLVLAYLHGWIANQLSAAVRLVPLGPTQAQRLQLRLAPLIARRAAELHAAHPRQLWSGGVGMGMAQLHHAELYSRLFRS